MPAKPLELRFVTKSDVNFQDYGDGIPPWMNAIGNNIEPQNKSTWYYPPPENPNAIYFLNSYRGNYFNDYIQYGYNGEGWASTRFMWMCIDVLDAKGNKGVDMVPNSDYVFNGTAMPIEFRFACQNTDFKLSIPYEVIYDVYLMNGAQIMHKETNTFDQFFLNGKFPGGQEANKVSFSIPPQGYSEETLIRIVITYPNGEATNSDVTLGFALFNPNYPPYRPCARYLNGKWVSCNKKRNPQGKVAGMLKRSDGNSFLESTTNKLSQMDDSQSNKLNVGTAQYLSSNGWRGSPKVGEE